METAPIASTPLASAVNYIGRGLTPVPIPRGSELRQVRNWREYRLDPERASERFGESDLNVGVLMGPASKGLSVVVVNDPVARKIANEALPSTAMIFGTGGAATHFCYRTNLGSKDVDALRLPASQKTGSGLPALEVLTGGGKATGCVLFPGSVAPTGERIEWAVDGEPARVDGQSLIRACRIIIAITVLSPVWPEKRWHCEAALQQLLRAGGWAPEEVDEFLHLADLAIGLMGRRYESLTQKSR